MTALTADRNTTFRAGTDFEFPVTANTKIFAGAIVAIDSATGLATKGATAATLRAVGIAQEQVDNTGQPDGANRVKVRRGVWHVANSGGADQLTLADVGADCYLVDDQTVAKTNGTDTRAVAGKVRDVDATGVWVEF
ncbi:hypothetical protein [Cupriavidus gilardii]|uniref:Head decoration protein n=1 Tax=Cupriavidus gilardii TaxID=82541 RepID=A0ABY4VLH1_9BURK|nr:hypothetical protein [Cupriavidus gilardii]NSX04810.1 hypothetical protein [Cupriavidus gilardii]USE78069.1 hypothetical protein NDR89_03205 [Cupriavidus gilardii]